MTEKNSLENIDYDILIKAYKYRLLVKESQKNTPKITKTKLMKFVDVVTTTK